LDGAASSLARLGAQAAPSRGKAAVPFAYLRGIIP
jgi:hypothetical protein